MSLGRIGRLFVYGLPLALLLTIMVLVRGEVSAAARPVVDVLSYHLTWVKALLVRLEAPELITHPLVILAANWLVAVVCVSIGSALLGYGFVPGDKEF